MHLPLGDTSDPRALELTMRFRDRADAGRRLAPLLAEYAAANPLVLGLPRGGAIVAEEIARALHAPMDVWIVRKVGAPHQPELGLGAVAEGGVTWLDEALIAAVGASPRDVETTVKRESAEVAARVKRFRRGHAPPDVEGRTVIVVDDGIATGGTVRAALQALRSRGPERIVLAVPVAAPSSLAMLGSEADAIACLHSPSSLSSIGEWYDDFTQVEDDEVVAALERARSRDIGAVPRPHRLRETLVSVDCDGVLLPGDLAIPDDAVGIVVFAHGSGSGRRSPRNRFVASALNEAGLATLLFDLLTPAEDRDPAARFDIPRLAWRVVAATRWLGTRKDTARLPIAIFGASTGAAAALVAASELPGRVAAVVSRGGRPDLAGAALRRVVQPSLLIVGGDDETVLGLNREARAVLGSRCELAVVPGATHLFEEPGTLERVARLAAGWLRPRLESEMLADRTTSSSNGAGG